MQLRWYQEAAKQEIYKAWNAGARNVLAVLPTGAGKTVLLSNIISENSGRAISIAHRMELVRQMSLTLARYGVRHNIIAQKPTIRACVAIHMQELKRSFYDCNASVIVAGIDTLIKKSYPWFSEITLVVQDEGHHPLKKNKWGRVAEMFPNARGLYPTATPVRADGYGLGRHADGIMDAIVIGPSARVLIDEGFLADYRTGDKIHIVVPPSDLDLSRVPLASSGDYSLPGLRDAVHKSHIIGDVVSHYLKFAEGKLGVTFAVDIKAAEEITASFKAAGVKAELITGKTPDVLRANLMRQFRNRQIMQLVNVDLLGEGVDVPAIEVVSMARPTQSYALYSQQFGRALRPLEGKSHAMIIDHVGNVLRHGLPDAPRDWSLDRRERRSRGKPLDVIPLKSCLNPLCMAVYERIHKSCPICGHYTPPQDRASLEQVDGDLVELDQETFLRLFKEVSRVDSAPRVPQNLASHAQKAIINRHFERQQSQGELRKAISIWAGYQKTFNRDDSEIYRRFYFMFNIDIMTAQTLNTADAKELESKIIDFLKRENVAV